MAKKGQNEGKCSEFWSAPDDFVKAFATGNTSLLLEAIPNLTLALRQVSEKLGPVKTLSKRQGKAYLAGMVARDNHYVRAMLHNSHPETQALPKHRQLRSALFT
jgi:hypothetical protein